jgi:hypothetical protein
MRTMRRMMTYRKMRKKKKKNYFFLPHCCHHLSLPCSILVLRGKREELLSVS